MKISSLTDTWLYARYATGNCSSNARFESSGCVRVDRVSTVVDWILGGQDGIDATEIEMITASQQPYDVKVANPPDVRFMYLTAWATEDGRVNFRPDIYGSWHRICAGPAQILTRYITCNLVLRMIA
jgi:murein L,D-transpeptidase YcbB/YkuD